MFARWLLAALFVAAASGQSLPKRALSKPAIFQQVDEMVSSLAEITGWKIERKVPSEMLSKEKFRKFVDSKMQGGSSRKEIRAEEITLKMFGFVPPEYDLARETVDLVSEQAAAFYDYNKKRLFILDSTGEGMEQRVVLVHELAHALADQHHPLGKYLHKGSPDDDAATARQAVMEGQATWLTWAYVAKRNGGKPELAPETIEQLTKTLGSDSADFPVFTKAPLYMRESLIFPYNEGLRFQDAVYRKLGRQGFDEVFTRPPAGTQQILHPEAYFADKKPLEVDAPSLPKDQAKDYKTLAEGSLGEFDFSVLLRQYVPEKEGIESASHWRGGAYRIYEDKRDRHSVLTFKAAWDSQQASNKFCELYQKVMKGKWKTMDIHLVSAMGAATSIQGAGDSGKFHLTCSGSSVESVEGLR